MNVPIMRIWNEETQSYVGVPIVRGEPGYVPQKGTDYWTEADKAEIIAAVKNSYQTEEWVFTLEDGSTVTKTVVVG